jgi:hypothetical protein
MASFCWSLALPKSNANALYPYFENKKAANRQAPFLEAYLTGAAVST